MRAVRRKRELLFVGWALVSSVLLLAAARGDEVPVYSTGPAQPAGATGTSKQPSAQEILNKAKDRLPADQYDAFEKAIRKLGNDNNSFETVIDGTNIPSVINFERTSTPAGGNRIPATQVGPTPPPGTAPVAPNPAPEAAPQPDPAAPPVAPQDILGPVRLPAEIPAGPKAEATGSATATTATAPAPAAPAAAPVPAAPAPAPRAPAAQPAPATQPASAGPKPLPVGDAPKPAANIPIQ